MRNDSMLLTNDNVRVFIWLYSENVDLPLLYLIYLISLVEVIYTVGEKILLRNTLLECKIEWKKKESIKTISYKQKIVCQQMCSDGILDACISGKEGHLSIYCFGIYAEVIFIEAMCNKEVDNY